MNKQCLIKLLFLICEGISDILNVSHVPNEKGAPQNLGYRPNGFVSRYCQELFPGKYEVLIWQSCEILTAMLGKYRARIVELDGADKVIEFLAVDLS